MLVSPSQALLMNDVTNNHFVLTDVGQLNFNCGGGSCRFYTPQEYVFEVGTDNQNYPICVSCIGRGLFIAVRVIAGVPRLIFRRRIDIAIIPSNYFLKKWFKIEFNMLVILHI